MPEFYEESRLFPLPIIVKLEYHASSTTWNVVAMPVDSENARWLLATLFRNKQDALDWINSRSHVQLRTLVTDEIDMRASDI